MNTQIDLSEYLPEIDKEEDASDDRKLFQRAGRDLFQRRGGLPWYPFLMRRTHWVAAYTAAAVVVAVSADSWKGDKYCNCGNCSDERAGISIEKWTANSKSHIDRLILVLIAAAEESRHWITIDLEVKCGMQNYNSNYVAPTEEEFQGRAG